MIDRGRRRVLGVPIQACDLEAAAARVLAAARSRQALGVACLAVHGVMTAVHDADYRARVADLELTVADGQPVRWALNLLHGAALPQRVYGPDLTLAVCRAAAEDDLPIYLFGSTPDVLEALAAALEDRFPGLVIAGSQASRFRSLTEAERQEDLRRIRDSGARVVLVGLGCPRQETWVYENRTELGIPCLAVGAAFDFLSGNKPQAPGWMQRAGLEWLFRLFREPRRLSWRYLRLNPAFLARLLAARIGAANNAAPEVRTPPRLRPG